MILVAFGSSIGFCGLTPHAILLAARRALGSIAPVCAKSRLFHSPAWPDPADPPFLNAVVAVETTLEPEALLAALHALEAAFGRRRRRANAPRSLDLDLLDYDGGIITPHGRGGLVLPHPRMVQRDFVLAPLADIAPDWRHPITGTPVRDLLDSIETRTAAPAALDWGD